MSVEAHPLHWPDGWPRTNRPTRSRFNTSMAVARDDLFHELRLMGARDIVLSTNLTLRNDGLPRAQQREPEDPGAAVYWRDRNGSQRCMACDRWDRIRDNIQALRLSIAALRGLNRWGSSEIVNRAFTGFQGLPDPDSVSAPSWRQVLGLAPDCNSLAEAREAFRTLRRRYHPDTEGGNTDAFHTVYKAWEQAQRELCPVIQATRGAKP